MLNSISKVKLFWISGWNIFLKISTNLASISCINPLRNSAQEALLTSMKLRDLQINKDLLVKLSLNQQLSIHKIQTTN
jgi:hypothetical protein